MNDNSPVFKTEDDNNGIYIRENNPVGNCISKVMAENRDGGKNGYMLYSISDINPIPFKINHFIGVVTTSRVLDYKTMRCGCSLYMMVPD